MAYNQFKLTDLDKNFGIKIRHQGFLPDIFPLFESPQLLLDNLLAAKEEALGTEKAKSEHIVLPVIKGLKQRNADRFSYFSGYSFEVDSDLKLNGYCDFLFTAVPYQVHINSPVFCLVEAKNDIVEEGWGQCGAEMYAAKLFNERNDTPKKAIYGCVTNAFSWSFLKLEGHILHIDPNYIPLTFAEPQHVLAVLQWILDMSIGDSDLLVQT